MRNGQYRQLRRLWCEILIHSVFPLPEPLLSASYFILFCCSTVAAACSTAAVPSKTTSGGKQNKKQKIIHTTETHRIPQTKYEKVRSAYVRIKIHIIRSMLNEWRQKPKPRRQHSTHKKRTGWNKRCRNRNRKREGREEKHNSK